MNIHHLLHSPIIKSTKFRSIQFPRQRVPRWLDQIPFLTKVTEFYKINEKSIKLCICSQKVKGEWVYRQKLSSKGKYMILRPNVYTVYPWALANTTSKIDGTYWITIHLINGQYVHLVSQIKRNSRKNIKKIIWSN